MVSVIGSIFGKLFSNDRNNQNKDGAIVNGNHNNTLVIHSKDNASGDIEKIIKSLGNKNQKIDFNSDDTINVLKKEILTKVLSPVDMIGKTLSIAHLKKDDDTIKWLNYELSGYPKDYVNIPEYRIISVKLDIGVQYHGIGEMFDLRDHPIKIKYAGGVSSLENVINTPNSKITLFASLPSELVTILKTHTNLPLSGVDPNRAPYILSRSELDSLIAGLRSKISSYVSNQ